MRIGSLLRVAVLVALLAVVAAPPALAAPASPPTGPFIEAGGGYDGQDRCDPVAKPGVLAFRSLVMSAYPNTGPGGIGRACGVGGTSEHKEGRAWDWGVNVSVPSQRAAAAGVIDWLAATDEYGNRHAIARRIGIMYLIWNRRIFFPGAGWRTYCVQRNGACRDPEDGSVRHPHTDHVHFSFTWNGAYKRTTFWVPQRTFAVDASAHPSGSGGWILGGNGGVRTTGSSWFMGDTSADWSPSPSVAIASTVAGDGYWTVTGDGKVRAFGGAVGRGSIRQTTRVADMVAHPSGKGYWIVSRGGRVFSFGRVYAPDVSVEPDAPVVGIEATPSGNGAWLLTASGRVLTAGDAQHLGDAPAKDAIALARTASGSGYWIFTSSGAVHAFGDAPMVGGPKGTGVTIAGVAPSPTRLGYVMVTRSARTIAFGDAVASPTRAGAAKVVTAPTAIEE